MPSLIPTPDSEPPTEKQIRDAVYVFVGYRQGRAMKITRQALEDGLARGCLRWFYYVVPTEYKQEGRSRKATAWDRTLVIERKYLPVGQGITVEWNAWCERWGIPAMQVFTPAQKEQRIAEGKQVAWTDPGEKPMSDVRAHVAGAVGDPADEEVETAIIAASAEHDLDLEEPDAGPTAVQCAYCSAGPGEPCDAECSCLPCSKQRMMLAAAHMVFGAEKPQSGAPHETAPQPPRQPDKKFWED